jgi:hypothetical protein
MAKDETTGRAAPDNPLKRIPASLRIGHAEFAIGLLVRRRDHGVVLIDAGLAEADLRVFALVGLNTDDALDLALRLIDQVMAHQRGQQHDPA